jgi:heme-degrading monooxygenase HmoA
MRTPGCLGVRLRKTKGLAFWTLTYWENEEAMKSFRSQFPHREAMSRLAHWCDEASVAHWVQESQERPSWEQAVDQLLRSGRLSKVAHPSKDQEEGRIIVT